MAAALALDDFVLKLIKMTKSHFRLAALITQEDLKTALEWLAEHKKTLNGKILCQGPYTDLLAVYIAKQRSFAKVYWQDSLEDEEPSQIGKYLSVKIPAGLLRLKNLDYISNQTMFKERPFDIMLVTHQLQKSDSLPDCGDLEIAASDPDDHQKQTLLTMEEKADQLVQIVSQFVRAGGKLIDIESSDSAEELNKWLNLLAERGFDMLGETELTMVHWKNGDSYICCAAYTCPTFEQSKIAVQPKENDEFSDQDSDTGLGVIDYIYEIFEGKNRWFK